MFKSRVLKTAIALSAYAAAILTAPQRALAQLNVGRYGVQPGLEQSYLQYQLSGRNLNQMRAIPDCIIGFGLSCNKPGSALQQIIESNNGPSYQDLVIRAAGGEANFRNFASFYGNNPNLSLIPYASFWQNDNPYIMDGYGYVLGTGVNRSSAQGLGLVTKNFYWSPNSRGSSESLRNGLLDFKYSYGRLLLEEVAKIPNAREQIQSLDLPTEVKEFYLNNLSQGLRALNSGNKAQLRERILEVLSLPFTPDNANYGRPPVGIPEEYGQFVGVGLPGDTIAVVPPTELPFGESISLVPPYLSEGDLFVAQVPQVGGAAAGFPFWALGLIPLALLPFVFGGGGDDDDSSRQAVTPNPTPTPDLTPNPTPTPDLTPNPTPTPDLTPNPTPTPDITPNPTPTPDITPNPTPTPDITPNPTPTPDITPNPTPTPDLTPNPTPTPDITPTPGPSVKIPESSTVTPLFLLTLIMSLYSYRKWRVQRG